MRVVRAFNYYGSKVNAARHYSAPRFDTIVEPFAGGAGYSLAHREKQVVLVDRNPDVIDAWLYLIKATAADVLALPLLEPGAPVPQDLPRGARLIIGWNVMTCGVRPQSRLVPCAARIPSSYWGESKRAALASLALEIKHWQAFCLSYERIPNTVATWFVDPPYIGKNGVHYPNGNDAIDFTHLGAWCREREGQVIVCEGVGATWLPFRYAYDHASNIEPTGRRRAGEMVYEQ